MSLFPTPTTGRHEGRVIDRKRILVCTFSRKAGAAKDESVSDPPFPLSVMGIIPANLHSFWFVCLEIYIKSDNARHCTL